MKKITFIKGDYCIYCDMVMKHMEELYDEDVRYRRLRIEVIDEIVQPELAAEYEYYIVPVFALDGEIILEGETSKSELKKLFDSAVEE